MDMNRVFFLRKEDRTPRWRVIDADGKVVGRLATEIADALRGKDKASYTPHEDGGDYVVVINAEKIAFTGDKLDDKLYRRYTGWRGNVKTMTAREMLEKKPEEVLFLAVKGMLPKNRLASAQIKKLKIYAGENHPHGAQVVGFAPAA